MSVRAHCAVVAFDPVTNTVLTSATINVYNPGTVTPVGITIYDKNGNILSNPLTSDATTGLVDFYLGVAQEVDLVVSKASYTTRTYSNVPVLDDASNALTALLTTTGDIAYASSANTPARLPIGSTNQVLQTSGGVPAWTSTLNSLTGIGIGAVVATSTGLNVSPTALTSVSQVGISVTPTSTSAATTQVVGVQSQIITAAGSYTVGSGFAFVALSPSAGASSTITNQYGLVVNNQGGSGITNAYGVYINAQSGASSNNTALYAHGECVVGSGSLANGATSGFTFVSSGGGTPSGTPANSYDNQIPIRFNTADNKLYAYIGGGWKASGAFS